MHFGDESVDVQFPSFVNNGSLYFSVTPKFYTKILHQTSGVFRIYVRGGHEVRGPGGVRPPEAEAFLQINAYNFDVREKKK